MLFILVLACRQEMADVRVPGPATGTPENTEEPVPPTDSDPGYTLTTTPLFGFIGSPCASDADCHATGICLLDVEGFPQGMCSEPCDEFCPDAAGFPTTYCATVDRMPVAAESLGEAACTSRCDFSLYPGTGCRENYGCAYAERAGEPGVEGLVCLPGLESELSSCLEDLALRGVGFTTHVIADSSPADHPELICHVEDPVKVHTPLLGVEIRYIDSAESAAVAMACEGAHALADTAEDVGAENVAIFHHYGTYVCRIIAGTESLSRHAYGDAIDVAAFTFEDGTMWSVLDDWEDGDTSPDTDGGTWLYDTIHRWDDEDLWNILLTPEFNAAHDNHFHVDLTPGSDFLGVRGAVPPVGLPVEGFELQEEGRR